MSEAMKKEDNSEKFSRRSIVKTAAWTTPVIAAAVAAPAAAASPKSATVSFGPLLANQNWRDWNTTSGNPRKGTAPALFTITNSATGAIADNTITGTLVIQANTTPPTSPKAKGLGIASITGGTITSRTPATPLPENPLGNYKADTVTSSFTLTAGVAANASLDVPLTFGYQPATTTNGYTGTFTATLTLYTGTVMIGSPVQVTLSKTS